MSEYTDYGFDSSNATHAHAYLIKPLLELLEESKSRTILDLGCGNGSLTQNLIAQGFNAYGTDASRKGIALAREKYPDRFALQNLESDELPEVLKSIKFNTIISTEVVEHLYDPRKFIQFSRNVLLKNGGGELILSTPYHGYWKNLGISILGKWDKHLNPLWDGGHIKMWSPGTLGKLLTESGFTITAFKGCGRFPFFWKSMIMKAVIH